MRSIVLLISFAVTLLHNTEGYSFGGNVVDKLNSQIDIMNQLILQVEKTYRDDMYHHPLPKKYESTLERADAILNRASRVVEKMKEKNCQDENRAYEDDFGKSFDSNLVSPKATRRSNDDLNWKSNFYKALSRALKEEFQDEPLVQENVHDGFIPPTLLKKRRQ